MQMMCYGDDHRWWDYYVLNVSCDGLIGDAAEDVLLSPLMVHCNAHEWHAVFRRRYCSAMVNVSDLGLLIEWYTELVVFLSWSQLRR